MTKRTYQQYCPLAHALDLVGERWTLLIVRELQLGPRRFTDLQRGLPGLGPNLLSQRLQEMEARGIVTKGPLPPPAKIQAYTLTPSGQALHEAMLPLAQWGLQYLPLPIPNDEFLGTVPAAAGLQLLYRPTLASGETLAAEIQLEPDNFSINLSSTQLQIEQRYSPEAPLALVTEPKPLLGLATGMLTVKESLLANILQITRGTEEMAQFLFAQFSLPATN